MYKEDLVLQNHRARLSDKLNHINNNHETTLSNKLHSQKEDTEREKTPKTIYQKYANISSNPNKNNTPTELKTELHLFSPSNKQNYLSNNN